MNKSPLTSFLKLLLPLDKLIIPLILGLEFRAVLKVVGQRCLAFAFVGHQADLVMDVNPFGLFPKLARDEACEAAQHVENVKWILFMGKALDKSIVD